MALLCTNCVKSEALKARITSVGDPVADCPVCAAKDVATVECGRSEFKNPFRALIRYYYSETDYNGHLGGTNLDSLLQSSNPITNVEPSWNLNAYDDALQEILDPPYEEYDRGISFFAGYTDGVQNLHLISLKRDFDPRLREIKQKARQVNHFLLDDKLRRLLEPLVTRIESGLARNSILIRARLGYVTSAFPVIGGGWFEERHYRPYEASALSAPPPPLAGVGRMNRGGVSFLYLATASDTAVAEIRPHPGHYCSVGEFRARQDLRIADLSSLDVCDFATSDKQLEDFLLLKSIDDAFSLPVIPEQRIEYHFTQLLADTFRHLSYDGVCYRSSVGSGKNYVFFDPDTFEYEPGSAQVIRIDALTYVVADTQRMGGDDDEYLTRPDGRFV